MDLGLKGKGAIVTGGSLGIGASCAIGLAREGANVAVNYRRHDTEAKQVVAEIEKLGQKGLAVKADVSSYD
ncbi:MAG: SDR family NAD(P)-dependent oxidoreductase, partial [Verrucomicrobiota bacterium]|nr:SDR family NAD(P)-dependent oxidoreductase [Verrucomicrobiota bacterium]